VKKSKLLPRGLEIEFEGGLEEVVTAHGGVGLRGGDWSARAG